MKKILFIFLVLGLAVGFAACGDDDEPEKFVWNGDWNDPDDPNYKPEGYNPVHGFWRRDNAQNKGLLFSKDFKIYQITFGVNGSYTKDLWSGEYKINDKAYWAATGNNIWRYRIEGNKFYNNPSTTNENDWQILTRAEGYEE